MKKLLGVFFAMFVTMALVSSVYAGPADDTLPQLGDNTKFFGVSAGKTLPSLCDNYGYVWHLQVTSPGKLAGTVDTGGCGVWNVTGTFNKVDMQLAATNNTGNSCCSQFTYTGTVNTRDKTASGNWTNTCGGAGTWSMTVCK